MLAMAFPQSVLVLAPLLVCLIPIAHATDVAQLNRVTFAGNVFSHKEGEGPDGWVVLFCAEWYEPCQWFQDTYAELASKYGGNSEDDLFSRKTRFAQVSCASDKPLCNSQDVDTYPTIVHYRGGGRAGEWSQSGRTLDKELKSFTKWADKQMQDIDSIARPEVAVEAAAESSRTLLPTVAQFSTGVTSAQAMPMLIMLFAASLWLYRLAQEVVQGVQVLRQPADASARAAAGKEEEVHEDVQVEKEIAVHQELPAIVRCLPEAWLTAGVQL